MTRSRMQRLRGVVATDDQPVTVETQAVDAMRLATDNAALEHAVADMTVRLRHAEHERDEAVASLSVADREITNLCKMVADLQLERDDLKARELVPALTVYRRMVEQDAPDQPREDELLRLCAGCHANWIPRDPNHELCEDCDPNGRPDLTVWVDVVEPSKNGTT